MQHMGHKLCKFSQKRVKFQEKITQLLKNLNSAKTELLKRRQ